MRSGPTGSAWAGFLGVVTTGVWLDQAAKGWATAHLVGRPFVAVVDGLLELRYSLNAGVAFGVGQNLPPGYGPLLLAFVSALGVALLVVMFAKSQPDEGLLRAGVALLAAGGIGNLVDRLGRGEVIDFIHLRLGEEVQVGTFNVADLLIAIGFVPLILAVLRPQTPRPRPG